MQDPHQQKKEIHIENISKKKIEKNNKKTLVSNLIEI